MYNILITADRKITKVYGGQGPGQQQRRPKKESRTTAETHSRTGQAHMRPDMRMPVDIRVELCVTGLPVSGYLLARLQGVQCGNRNSTDHVSNNQLDRIQQLRMGFLWRMVPDEGIRKLPTVFGYGTTKRHRDRSGKLHQTNERLLSAGKYPI